MDDPHYLQRFVIAQDRDGTYDSAAEELGRGRKQTHLMSFVFPQIGPRTECNRGSPRCSTSTSTVSPTPQPMNASDLSATHPDTSPSAAEG